MTALISQYIVPLVSLIGALIAVYFAGRAHGKAKAEVKAAQNAATVTVAQNTAAIAEQSQAKQDAQNVERKTDAMDSGDIADSMQQYTRK
jgi:hypothetical protein